jgi:hypothetical protein
MKALLESIKYACIIRKAGSTRYFYPQLIPYVLYGGNGLGHFTERTQRGNDLLDIDTLIEQQTEDPNNAWDIRHFQSDR